MAAEPLFVAFTADVDPDANRAVPGRADAVSPAGDRRQHVRLDACFDGLPIALEALQDGGLPATLFWEGRTLGQLRARRPALFAALREAPSLEHGCHGHEHEDFAGKVSGLPLGADQTGAVLERAGAAFADAFGAAPRGFRAPYCRLTPALAQALAAAGYAYDASLTRGPADEERLRPYKLPEAPALYELPLCSARDTRGKRISCYLHQLFEGNRPVADYVRLVTSVRAVCGGGLLQIALHPWHLIVSAQGRPLALHGSGPASLLLRELVRQVAALDGVAFTTCGTYLARFLQSGR